MFKKSVLFLVLLVLPFAMVSAQDPASTPDPMAMDDSSMMMDGVPSVTVSDQISLDGTVLIDSAYSASAGFVVIHIDNGGAPGPVIGQRSINAGWNFNIAIDIAASQATPMMFAMLHLDDCAAGVYEFGTVAGCDSPVAVDGAVVTPAFNVAIINVFDQPYSDAGIGFTSATIPVDGWMVIHSEANGGPGPVLGQSQISAGTSSVTVIVAAEGRTDNVWPMLHIDDCAIGTYEFGTVEGCDAPVIVDGAVATTQMTTVSSARVADQVVIHGDNAPEGAMMMMMDAPAVMAKSVVSVGPGFLVIHTEADGAPGPVAGVAAVSEGLNVNVNIVLDMNAPTPNLWPMLHVDDCAVGTYEFGTVAGCDAPVRVNDAVVTFPISAAPSMTFSDQALEMHDDGEMNLHIDSALIDAHGWLVIHSSADGAPGPVLNQYPLLSGNNTGIEIAVDPAAAGAQVFPMMHYDTCAMGVYEFGIVEGCDSPVFVAEAVVVAPLAILSE